MASVRNLLLIALFILSSAFIAQAEQDAEPKAEDSSQTTVDQDALEILKEMSDALSSLKQFTFDTEVTNDQTIDSGQTIQISGTMKTSVKRPSHVYAKYTGDFNTREVWYAGNKLTLFDVNKNYYGVLKTPDTIDATMDFLIENYDFSLPLADILNADPYNSFMDTTVGGFIVGDSTVRGKECTHLAFTGKYVDWQIWISNDDPALPYKLVINYKQIEGVPQYQAIFSNWNTNPDLSDSVFTPELPKDAVKIDFIDLKKQEGDKK